MLEHEESLRRFPTGGWGGHWVTDPARGSGERQPGGWVHSLLPYLQRSDLYNDGRDLSGADKRAAVTRMVQSPVTVFNCPSRRDARLYSVSFAPAQTPVDANYLTLAARSDYAANAGDQERCEITAYGGPTTLEEGDDPAFLWPDVADHTGIVYLRSQTQMAHVRDGKAHTYLLAEKHVPPSDWYSGVDHGDDWSMYTGYQDDICRTTYYSPIRDDHGLGGGVPECRFGSAHPGGFNAAFCDGGVRNVAYEIEPEVHRLLGNRADNQIVDVSDLP
jgi:prepilin-type processing-associated H-X9-DG protein